MNTKGQHASNYAPYFTIVLLVAIGTVAAQSVGQKSRGFMHGPLYDPATEISVTGVVNEVEQLTGKPVTSTAPMFANCPRGWAGTHLSITTDQGTTIIVHVGPSTFLAQNNFALAKGDKLAILGSKVQYVGSEFLIAREISKGDQSLKLRDNEGFPLWSGARKGNPVPNSSPGK